MCPPSFLTGLKPELSIKDGSRMELKVQVKGDPDPQVSWMKDGKPISSNEVMEVKYKNGVASVIINEVFPEDGGKSAPACCFVIVHSSLHMTSENDFKCG